MWFDRYLTLGRRRLIVAAGVVAVAGILLIIDHSLLRHPGPERLWRAWFDEEPAKQPAAGWLVWAGLASILVGVGAVGVLMQTARRRLPDDPPDSDEVSRFRPFLWILEASWGAALVAYVSSPESALRTRTLVFGLALPFLTLLGLWFAAEWSITRGRRRWDESDDDQPPPELGDAKSVPVPRTANLVMDLSAGLGGKRSSLLWPRIRIDGGRLVRVGWTARTFAVTPGQHNVAVWFVPRWVRHTSPLRIHVMCSAERTVAVQLVGTGLQILEGAA